MKKSIHISNASVEIIGAHYKGDAVNWSGAVNMIIDRYHLMVKTALQNVDLAPDEWAVLFRVYNGTITGSDAEGMAKLLIAEVVDNDLASEALLSKLRDLNTIERLAVIDVIERSFAEIAEDADIAESISGIISKITCRN